MSLDLQTEPGGLVAELCAKLDLHIGSTDKLAKAVARQKPPSQPVFGRTAGAGLFVTGLPLVISFPLKGPDQGHFWYVRSIVVGGLSPTVAAAGRADVYISAAGLGGVTPSLAAIGLADWRDQSIALPNVSFYGTGEMPLRLNEELFVVVTGGTNGQQYVAAVQFEDYEEAARKQDWSM